MRYFHTLLILHFSLYAAAQDPVPPIGEWREHLPYKSCIGISAGNGRIYGATPYSFFSLDPAQNVTERFSRVSGLHETGISNLFFDEENNKLVIAYKNSNIDILYRNDIFNVPDIKRDNIVGDKTIYRIFSSGGNYYLSTGLGVILVSGSRYEVSDSWLIGNNGSQVRVNGFTATGNFFYAATAEGLKQLPANSPNPANYANWQLISGSNGLPAGNCAHIIFTQNKLIAAVNDSLFLLNGTAWTLLYTDGWDWTDINLSEQKILLCELQGTARRIRTLDINGTVLQTIDPQAGSIPKMAILNNNTLWVADSTRGLISYESGNTEISHPVNSPDGIANGDIFFSDRTLLAASGTIDGQRLAQGDFNGIYEFREGEWINYSRSRFPVFDSIPDLLVLAADKRDGSVWAGSFGGGLLHLKAGPVFEVFKQNFLGPDLANPGQYRVSGLAFDRENNLWISNDGAADLLLVRRNDGSRHSFQPPFLLNRQAVSQIRIDPNGFLWIVSPAGNGLICYDPGSSIDNSGDDRWRLYRMGSGSGNLPSADVLSVAVDKNGFIWVGTSDGIGVIQCPDQAFDNPGCDAIWPVIPAGNFAGYLFKGQVVQALAVDGADRKWVGTRNGVFLVNPEGEKLVYRFTVDNSPLLSNDVQHICIDPKTGEVFFATANGICSFRSTATSGAEQNEELLVFPNPVPPGYTGTIAIRGLVNNAIVKITELDGRLVYQTRALGGQAIWDGKNYRGERVASGAYLVLVSDDGSDPARVKRERAVTKIFFISH